MLYLLANNPFSQFQTWNRMSRKEFWAGAEPGFCVPVSVPGFWVMFWLPVPVLGFSLWVPVPAPVEPSVAAVFSPDSAGAAEPLVVVDAAGVLPEV